MPRTKRRMIPGCVYHVIARFVDRAWFIESEPERATYLGLLGRAIATSDWRCLAYAIMSNHIHLALVVGDDSLASWIRRVHSPFADTLNRSRGRIGSIFTRGPKEILVPDGRVGQLLAYIHNNPVRANVVAAPADCTWTSHRAYVGRDVPPRWLHVDEGLQRAGLAGSTSFDAFVQTTTAHPVLGPTASDEHFRELLEAYAIAQAAALAHDPLAPAPADPDMIIATVADVVGLAVAQLTSRRRGPLEQLARTVVIQCGAMLGLTSTQLGDGLLITPQAVRKSRSNRDPERAARVRELVEEVMRRMAGHDHGGGRVA